MKKYHNSTTIGSTPDYKRIYTDILDLKYSHKKELCKPLLRKKELSVLDVLELNHYIFGPSDKETESLNQKHRSYNQSVILQILEYQKKHNLNNTQLANHFKLSRNTVAKWRKIYSVSV